MSKDHLLRTCPTIVQRTLNLNKITHFGATYKKRELQNKNNLVQITSHYLF